MNRNRLLIALIVLLIIAALVLMRGPVNAIFAPNPEAAQLSAAQKQFDEANNAAEEAQKSLEQSKMDMQTQEDAYNAALKDREDAAAALSELGESPATTTAEDKSAPLRVEVIKSQSQDIASGIALSGNVEAARKLELRAETSGQVISEPIGSGAEVKKDDILCELEPGSRLATLTQAEAAFATAQTQYQSTLSLKNRGLASTAALQSAKANLEQAQSAVEGAEREVDRLQIRAPFDGILVNQTAELGSLMQPGSICASLIALDRLLLVGYASELQVDRIREGASAIGTLRDGQKLAGEVSFVAATADPSTRTYRTEVSVANSGNVRDGSSVRIEIALAGTKGHLIPQNALTLNDDGTLGVKLFSEGTAVFVPVDMVRDTPNGIWVTGLDDNVNIIIEGQEYATDGQAVEAVFTEGAQS